MHILNYPFKGNTKIPGAELATKIFMKDMLLEDNAFFKRNNVIHAFKLNEIELRAKILEMVDDNFLLILGGDHSTTAKIFSYLHGMISKIIIFDAHNDYEDSVIDLNTVSNWNFINSIENEIERGICLGYRYRNIHMPFCSKIEYITDIEFMNWSWVKNKLEQFNPENDRVYVSVDLDVLNCTEFPGVGFGVPGGIALREFLRCLEYIISKYYKLVIDISEFNPLIEKEKSLEVYKYIINWIEVFNNKKMSLK